jgi:NADH pyrophosphatase NudC (nudix superfamily)
VDEGETADEAVIREVKEETGIDCVVKGLMGLRTGVLSEEISDNLLVFLLEPLDEGRIQHQENELYEARFMAPEDLLQEKDASIMLHYLINQNETSVTKPGYDGLNPGDHFNYSAYKLFF